MKSIRRLLEANGWKLIEVRSRRVLWMDSKTGWVLTQADAVRHQRYRDSVARIARSLTFTLIDARGAV